MFLRTLTLESFRSYQNVSFNLNARRVLVAGVNGSGKSSLAEAIRWLITNVSTVTDGRGAGVEHLQPTGSPLVSVSGVLDPIGLIKRHKINSTPFLSIENIIGPPNEQQMALLYKLDTSKVYLEAVMTSDNFLNLHHAEAKDLVLKLLDVRVPYDGVDMTLEQIDLRYQNAFAERRDMRRRVQLSKPVDPVPVESYPPLPAIEVQLAKLRSDLEARVQGVGESDGKRQILQKRYDRIAADIAGHVHEDLEQLHIWLVDTENALAEAEAAEPNLPPLDPRDVAQTLQVLTSRRDAIAAHNPKNGCVLDAAIACPQKKMEFTKRKREIDTEISGLPPVGETRERRPIDRLRELHADYTARVAKSKEAARLIQEWQVELEALQAEMNSLLALSPEQKADIEMLRLRIRKGEDLYQAAEKYAHTCERHQELVAQQVANQARLNELEALCDTLGPNGLRAQALGKAISIFTAKINAFTEAYGWEVGFTVEPWGVVVNERPIQTYSESEQFRIGIAIQLAIAELSGLSFAVIDRLDMLDLHNRNLATKMLMESSVGQILILATREPTQPLPTPSKDLFVYRVGNVGGQSTILEAGVV